MSGPVIEYGPSGTRSPIVLIVFALATGGFVWLAADIYVSAPDGDLAFAAASLVLAALLGALGFVFWRWEPEFQGRLEISLEGVSLEQWEGTTVPPTQAGWSEIAALHRWRTRRSAFYGIELKPQRGGRRGQVVAVAGAGLEPQSLNPLAAMEQYAREAGYDIDYAETAKGRRGRDRWRLVGSDASSG